MPGITLAQALVEATQLLRKNNVPDARRDAATILANIIGRDQTFLIAHAETELSATDVNRLKELAERRGGGEPLQYILGQQEFYNLDFEVGPGVLIPRPETEVLVERALDLIPLGTQFRICDVGTGTGCIAISLLYERPLATAVGLDISKTALGYAQRNAERLGLTDRLELRQSDGFAALKPGEKFDLIVSNPPYVAETTRESLQREVRDHEPHDALFSGADGLTMIRRLLNEVPAYLGSGGNFLFEMGFDQAGAVNEIVADSKLTLVDVINDLQQIPRIILTTI